MPDKTTYLLATIKTAKWKASSTGKPYIDLGLSIFLHAVVSPLGHQLLELEKATKDISIDTEKGIKEDDPIPEVLGQSLLIRVEITRYKEKDYLRVIGFKKEKEDLDEEEETSRS